MGCCSAFPAVFTRACTLLCRMPGCMLPRYGSMSFLCTCVASAHTAITAADTVAHAWQTPQRFVWQNIHATTLPALRFTLARNNCLPQPAATAQLLLLPLLLLHPLDSHNIKILGQKGFATTLPALRCTIACRNPLQTHNFCSSCCCCCCLH
jgi:hypothetical protein